MDQALPGRGPGPALGGDVGQPRAEREHQIGFGKGGALRIRVPEAEVARRRAGERSGTGPGGGRRRQPATAKPRRSAAAPRARPRCRARAPPAGSAARRRAASLPSAPHLRRGRRRTWHGGGRQAAPRRARQHVLGQGKHHRPRHAAHRHGVAARDQLRHLLGLGRLAHPLRDAAEHPRVVDLLEGVAAQVALLHLPDEQDQRHRVLLRGMDGDGGVARAGPARDQHHARPPRQLRVRHRHEAGAAFAAAGDEVKRRVRVQRIEKRDVALARHAEGAVHALRGEERDQPFGGGGHGRAHDARCRRISRPGRSPVRPVSPRHVGKPLVQTSSMPSAGWIGSSKVARSITRCGSNSTRSA